MISGRIYVTESQIICGSRDGTANVLYPHPTYTHPSTKQCNYTYTHPSTIQCSASSRLSSIESKLTQGISSIKYGSYTMPETINWNLTYCNRQVGFNYAIELGVSPKIVIIF